MTDERIVSPETNETEELIEKSLRPQFLAQYIKRRVVDLHSSSQKSGRSIGSCAALRTTWIRKDDNGDGHRQ